MIPELTGFHLPVFMAGCPITSQKPIQQRPWPPIYRQHSSSSRNGYFFRHHESPQWLDYPRYGGGGFGIGGYREKGREYYYLAPLYRNAMPPPPQPTKSSPPRRIMLLNPHQGNNNVNKKCYNECPCWHRSRSLEDVRSEMNSEWSDDDVSMFRHDTKKSEGMLPNGYGRGERMFLDDFAHLDSRRRRRGSDDGGSCRM